jgi:hypothetical protein
MNKLKFLFLILIITSIQCKKATTEISIIGKWVMVSSTWKQYKNNVLTKEGTESIAQVGVTLNFRTDNKVTATDVLGGISTYDYKYAGGKLELGDFKIIELTSSKLVYTYENDVTTTQKEVVTQTFNKVN